MQAHHGRQLTAELVAQNSVILVMEQRHLNDLHSRYPEARGKTFLLGKWIENTEIPDPYRQSKEAFEHVYALIDSACSAWQKYL
jgi:protein-tyrosine phosphatase